MTTMDDKGSHKTPVTHLVPEEASGPAGDVKLVEAQAEVVAVHGIRHATLQSWQ